MLGSAVRRARFAEGTVSRATVPCTVSGQGSLR